MAPGAGFEPATYSLHEILMFPCGVDYLITPAFAGGWALFARLLLGLTC